MHPRRLVLWIIWLSILSGSCAVYYFFAGKTAGSGNVSNLFRLFPLALLLASVAIRFFAIPRFKSLAKALPPFIVGLSLAEGSGIVATFLLSAKDAQVYFVSAVFVLSLYAPLFANKIEHDDTAK